MLVKVVFKIDFDRSIRVCVCFVGVSCVLANLTIM